MVVSVFPQQRETVAVLLRPNVVPLIDVFRALRSFEADFDILALDEIEGTLSGVTGGDFAKGLVSDALLLAFGLRQERARLDFSRIGARRGNLFEYQLISLIAAVYHNDESLAAMAADALGVKDHKSVVALASDVAERLKKAAWYIDPPDARLLIQRTAGPAPAPDDGLSDSHLKLSFDG